MLEEGKRYRAFISYSQRDKARARRIHQALESYRLPREIEIDGVDAKTRKFGRLFRDDDEMGAATDLGAALQGAIADAENLIVVCSPNAAKSRWVNEEIIHFKRTGRADRIFAVIVGGEPTPAPDRQEHECFPPALQFELGPDGDLTDRPTEPLGLDVRKESFSRLIVRLAAGLLRTPFDALWQREQRRTRARAVTIALCGAATLFIFGAAITQNVWRPEMHRYLHYRRFVHSNAELNAAQPGTTFQDCDSSERPASCPIMVIIPAGQFLMGAVGPEDDGSYGMLNALPMHRVRLRRFAVSKYDITFADWDACVADGGCIDNPHPNRDGWAGQQRPIINVTWNDAQQYAHWLSQATGEHYRLLSEAEWEYAARGQTNLNEPHTRYPWGDDEPLCDAHARNGAAFGACPEDSTWPVGSFPANAFGLHDMAGNVMQWVEDCYASYRASQNSADPVERDNGSTSATCDLRVNRGGSWDLPPETLRSAYRFRSHPDYKDEHIGFRVARTL